MRRPGDQILDRYCPNLSPADREIARERLEKLARLLVRIAMRQVREERSALKLAEQLGYAPALSSES